MVVAGASRHAKEIIELLLEQNLLHDLFFFDDVSKNAPEFVYQKFRILRSIDELREKFAMDNRFILGLGGPAGRILVAKKMKEAGGTLTSIVAKSAIIGHFDLEMAQGLNIMQFAFISNSVKLDEGCLINSFASIHHDVHVGAYTEISPRAVLLGGAQVGSVCSIGSGAIILPNINVGNNVVVGAGAVVTKNVPDNSLVVGVPGKITQKLSPINF